MVCVEQRLAIIDSSVVEQQAVDLLIDGLLRSCRIQSRNSGQESDIIIDEGLAAHGELLAVGVELSLRKQLGLRQICLNLTVLRNLHKITNTTDEVLMVSGCLEVSQAALGGEFLEGGRHLVVNLNNGLADGAVQDGRERCGRVVELAAQHLIEFIGALTDELAGILTVSAQAVDGQVAQAHAAELTSAFVRLCNAHTGSHHETVAGGVAELILLSSGYLYSSVDGLTILVQLLKDSCTNLVCCGAVGDVAGRVLTELSAESGNLGASLALSGCCSLSIRVGLAFAGISVVVLGVCRNFRHRCIRSVDGPLKCIKLCLFSCVHLSAFIASCGKQFLLPLNHFLDRHDHSSFNLVRLMFI